MKNNWKKSGVKLHLSSKQMKIKIYPQGQFTIDFKSFLIIYENSTEVFQQI